jgi:hypothetical protein
MTDNYGLLVSGFDYSTVAEDEFNDWYDTEHVPERERMKGFMRVQRWLGADNPKLSIVSYELESIDVLASPAYRAVALANMSPWSRRMSGRCKRVCRFEAEQILPGQQAAPADAAGMMMFATNMPAEADADFNAWFDEEHIPALSNVAGVLCARRFRMAAGTHRYLAMYHLTAPEVQASADWKAAADTPWTLKMRPYFRDPLRLVLRRYVRTA